MTGSLRYLVPAALGLTCWLAAAGDASARTHFNSLTRMRTSAYKNLSLADVNGDGRADLVGFTQDEYGFKISVGSADWPNPLMASFDSHGVAGWGGIHIDKIFTGHFDSPTRESVCFRSKTNGYDPYWESIYCFVLYGSSSTLSPTSSDPSPHTWDPGDAYAVGDVDGNGYDELLVYSPWNIRSLDVYDYAHGPAQGFWHHDFDLGNLPASWSGNFTELYVGDFADFGVDGSGRRDDLLIYNRSTGELQRLDSRVAGGKTVYWVAWNTFGTVQANEEIGVADADGNGFEDLILHDTQNGLVRFLTTLWPVNALPYGQPEQGQIPTTFTTPFGSRIYWGLMKYHAGEGGNTNTRDDAFVYFPGSDSYSRYDARFYNGVRTYWWYYTKPVSAIKAALGMTYLE
jgi:hypothetical protein